MNPNHTLVFALGGHIVRHSNIAMRICHQAVKDKKEWLILQSLSVADQLRAAERATKTVRKVKS